MKKIKNILLIILLFVVSINNVYASTNTFDRTLENNYGVNKKWQITNKNKSNVLRTPMVDSSEKVYDFAEILDEEEEEEIYNQIIDFKETTNMELIFVTVDMPYSVDSQNEDFAADFYDYNDFGIDLEHYSGILLLRNAYVNDPYYDMYTFGEAQLYFNSGRYDDILDSIYSDFHSHNYLDGFELFKEKCQKYIEKGVTNKNAYIDEKGFVKHNYVPPYVIITLVAGALTTIVMLVLVSKNKMIKKATQASEYVNKSSINFTTRSDVFLSTVTTSHAISTSSSGGSHSGSSGGGHSSGGGRHG